MANEKEQYTTLGDSKYAWPSDVEFDIKAYLEAKGLTVPPGTVLPSLYEDGKIFVVDGMIVNLDQFITKNEADFGNIVQMEYLLTNFSTKKSVTNLLLDYYKKHEIDTKLNKYYEKPVIDQMKLDLEALFSTFDATIYYTKPEIDDFINNIDKYTKAEINTMLSNITTSVQVSDTALDDKIKLCVTLDAFNAAIQETVTPSELATMQASIDTDIQEVKDKFLDYVTTADHELSLEELRNDVVANETLQEYVTLISLENILENYYTKTEINNNIYTKVQVDTLLTKYTTTELVNNLLSNYTLTTKHEADKEILVADIQEVKDTFINYYTKEDIDNINKTLVTTTMLNENSLNITNMFNSYYNKSTIDTKLNNLVTDMNTGLENYFTKDDIDTMLTNYTTRTYVDGKLSQLANKSTVYTKLEIDNLLTNIINDFTDRLTDYYKKAEVDTKISVVNNKFNNYYLSSAMDIILEDYVLKSDLLTKLNDYSTTTQISTTLEDYYNKEDVEGVIDDKITDIGLDTKLSDYTLKTELTTKLADYATITSVDDKILDARDDTKAYTDSSLTSVNNNITSNISTVNATINNNKTLTDTALGAIDVRIDDVEADVLAVDTKIDIKVASITNDLTDNYFTKDDINSMNNVTYPRSEAVAAITDLGTKINDTNIRINNIDLSPYAKIAMLDNLREVTDIKLESVRFDLTTKITTTNNKFNDYYTSLYIDDNFVTLGQLKQAYDSTDSSIVDIYNKITGINTDITNVNSKFSDYVLKTNFDTYKGTIYTKPEVDALLTTLNMYSKSDIDTKISDINTSIGTTNANVTLLGAKINNTYTKHDTEVLISNSANTLTGDINTVDSKLNDYLLVNDFNTFKTSNTTSTNNLSARIDDNKNRLDNLNSTYYNKTEVNTVISASNSDTTTYINNNTVSKTDFNTYKGLVYTKTEVDTRFSSYYTKAEIDTMIDNVTTYDKVTIDNKLDAATDTAVNTSKAYTDSKLLNYKTSTELSTILNDYTTNDTLTDTIASFNATHYSNSDIDGKLNLRPTTSDVNTTTNQAILTNNLKFYEKFEINAKLLALEESITHDNDSVYTKAQVDTLLEAYAKEVDVDLDILGLDGRLSTVEVKLGDTYNKNEVDTKINSAVLGSSLEVYTKNEVNTLLISKLDSSSFSTFVNNVYTKSQVDNMVNLKVDIEDYNNDLSNVQNRISAIETAQPTYALKADYYKKDEIDVKLTDIATEGFVTTSINGAITTNNADYLTEAEINTTLSDYVLTTVIDTKLSDYVLKTNFDSTVSQFYTKSQIDTKLLAFNDIYTKTQIDTKLSTITASQLTGTDIDNKITTNNSNYYTKIQIDTTLTDYYTKPQIDTMNSTEITRADNKYAIKTDLNNYYTSSSVDTKLNSYLPLTGGAITGNLSVSSNLNINGVTTLKNILAENINVANFFNTSHVTGSGPEYDLLTINSNKTQISSSSVIIDNALTVKATTITNANITGSFTMPLKVIDDENTKTDLLTYSDAELYLTSTSGTLVVSNTNTPDQVIYNLQGNNQNVPSVMLGYSNGDLYLKTFGTSTWTKLANTTTLTNSNTAMQIQIDGLSTLIGTKLDISTFNTYKLSNDTEIANIKASVTTTNNNITTLNTTLRNDLVNKTGYLADKTLIDSRITTLEDNQSNYATKLQLDMSALTLGGRMDVVEHKVDVNGSQMVLALDNYYTKAEIDTLFVTNRVIDYDSGTDVELADTDPDLFNVGMSGSGGGTGLGGTFTPSVSEDGIISWTNDNMLTNPEPVNVKGPKGDIGLTGPQGAQGIKGDTGAKGDPGTNGTNGLNGKDGKDGINGTNGIDGIDGTNGVDGSDGRDGTGLNTGGTTNQILIKNDANDYNTSWSDLKTINGKSLLGVGDLRAEIEAIVLAMSMV